MLLQSASAPQTIDRLVAVVGGEPIFLSDVRDVVRLRLLDPAGPLAPLVEAPDASIESRALQRMINRRLVLAEVARYSQATPPAADLAAARTIWAARFDAPPPHDPAFVRAFLVDTLRIDRYIEQRFTAAAQPTREEARAYYDADPSRFARADVPARFEDVEDDARDRLAEERRLAMVREWLEGLRARGGVRVVVGTLVGG
ncbi:MAG TPA: hypothetical protein VMN81_03090 [Vicinamibacterales bacterium]|nr:hypothetical protein [Vicinamibacterales bacterium]